LHERYLPDIHIDLLHYGPNKSREFHYVATRGMSDCPMTDAGSTVLNPLRELVIALPPEWDVSPVGFKNPAIWQPFRLLKMVARYPRAKMNCLANLAIGR
jgi:hypothetical protein